MRNYLAAECYKTFRRKYFYIALAVCLGLELVLLWCYWLTMSWGNTGVSFATTAVLVPLILSVGLYAPLITGDIVFSDQYKNNTLKNEVSYGVPRARIYLGKLAVTALASVIAALVMLGLYLGGCWLLFPMPLTMDIPGRWWATAWRGPSPCGWRPWPWSTPATS